MAARIIMQQKMKLLKEGHVLCYIVNPIQISVHEIRYAPSLCLSGYLSRYFATIKILAINIEMVVHRKITKNLS